MTEERMALAELMQKAGKGDFLRAVAEAVLQILMETDVEGLIGAARHERSPDRLNYRNGYRDRSLDTRLGALQLRVPKLRQGSYFAPFLEPRKMTEKALVAVIQEAWSGGVSTRRVDDLVQAMGLTGISKSQVSKLCKDIDERVLAFPGAAAGGRVALSVARRHLPQAARRLAAQRTGRPAHASCSQRPAARMVAPYATINRSPPGVGHREHHAGYQCGAPRARSRRPASCRRRRPLVACCNSPIGLASPCVLIRTSSASSCTSTRVTRSWTTRVCSAGNSSLQTEAKSAVISRSVISFSPSRLAAAQVRATGSGARRSLRT